MGKEELEKQLGEQGRGEQEQRWLQLGPRKPPLGFTGSTARHGAR